jgi:hypothetical protein
VPANENAELARLLRVYFERCWAAGITEWVPGAIAAGGYETTTVPVTGARVGDPVVVSLDSMLDNPVMLTGHVTAADTVRVVLFNPTAGGVNIGWGMLVAAVRVRY